MDAPCVQRRDAGASDTMTHDQSMTAMDTGSTRWDASSLGVGRLVETAIALARHVTRVLDARTRSAEQSARDTAPLSHSSSRHRRPEAAIDVYLSAVSPKPPPRLPVRREQARRAPLAADPARDARATAVRVGASAEEAAGARSRPIPALRILPFPNRIRCFASWRVACAHGSAVHSKRNDARSQEQIGHGNARNARNPDDPTLYAEVVGTARACVD